MSDDNRSEVDCRSSCGKDITLKSISSFPGIFICRQAVDGRKQINTLAAFVESDLGQRPFEGSLFVFINRRRDTVKILYYDRTGFALWIKRLEKNVFKWLRWPSPTGVSTITESQLELLLYGYDVFSMAPHEEIKFSRTI